MREGVVGKRAKSLWSSLFSSGDRLSLSLESAI